MPKRVCKLISRKMFNPHKINVTFTINNSQAIESQSWFLSRDSSWQTTLKSVALKQCFSTAGSRPTFGSQELTFGSLKPVFKCYDCNQLVAKFVMFCFVGRQPPNVAWEPLLSVVLKACYVPNSFANTTIFCFRIQMVWPFLWVAEAWSIYFLWVWRTGNSDAPLIHCCWIEWDKFELMVFTSLITRMTASEYFYIFLLLTTEIKNWDRGWERHITYLHIQTFLMKSYSFSDKVSVCEVLFSHDIAAFLSTERSS